MTLDVQRTWRRPEHFRHAMAEVPLRPGMNELEYYFLARTKSGLERRAPPAAEATYRMSIKAEDD